ncbi:hypothetical protein NQ315_009692 [Exocentrus adspersus]|uniref:Mediator of DNA damage checkpoint protein 1 n=1 Tax=Exocentrus adspersus TaxID=1586481 RepID=A0AAV8WGG4_9CUCU|nr:hypothetical protein NQ315_009692 [Exocentrus adspersus]
MSNDNCFIMTDKYKRIQGGKLKVQNSIHPIYKGVNTVGRNKTAVINLKNLNISQNHALIIIVDDTQHFISDLNSSNGTYLFGAKLSPYKLYELPNDVDIKFGDISTTYFKMSFVNSSIIHVEQSMEMTQNMTQNFYGAETQIINESSLNQTRSSRISRSYKENIHEAPTQVVCPPIVTNTFNSEQETNFSVTVVENDIHEAPTQVVDYHQASRASTSKIVAEAAASTSYKGKRDEQLSMNIHEMATQVVDLPEKFKKDITCKSGEEQASMNIHEAATQVDDLPDVFKKSESEKTNTSSASTEIYGGSSQTSKTSHKERNDFASQLQKQPDVSMAIEESIIEETVVDDSHINEISNDSMDFLSTNKPSDKGNDNVSTFSSSLEIGVSRNRTARKLSSSEDISQPQDTRSKCNSDSDTDVENDLNISKRIHTDLDKSKPVDSGSDTDAELNKGNSNPDTCANRGGYLPTQPKADKSNVFDSDSETDIEDNMPEPSQAIKPKASTKKRILDSDSETDVDNTPKEVQSQSIKPKIINKRPLDSDSETDIEEDGEKEPGQGQVEALNDTDCIPATQDAFGDIFMYKQESKTQKSNINSQNLSSEESFRLGLTELMVESVENKVDDIHEEGTTDKDDGKQADDKDNEKAETSDAVENKNETVETIFKDDVNEDLLVMATENICGNMSGDTNNKDKLSIDKSLPSTSKVVSETLNTDAFKDDVNEDLFIMATENISENTSKPKDKLNADKALSSTSAENKLKIASDNDVFKDDVNEDLLVMATENIGADISKDTNNENKNADAPLPTNSAGDKTKVVSEMLYSPADEDVYMMATQKISDHYNTHKEISDAPSTSAASENAHVEKDADDEFYIMPTQNLKEQETESQFKVPHKKFNFRRKEIRLDASLSTILNNKTDPYTADTQQLGEADDIYMQATQELNDKQEADVSQDTNIEAKKCKDDEFYMAPTQQINIESKPTTSKAVKEDDYFYAAPTQPIKSKPTKEKNADSSNEQVDDLYSKDTQEIGSSKHFTASEKDNDEDLYLAPTQCINLNEKNEVAAASKPSKEPDPEVYIAATQPMSLVRDHVVIESVGEDVECIKKPEVNKNQEHKDVYLAATQEINHGTNGENGEVAQSDFVVPIAAISPKIGSVSGKKRHVDPDLSGPSKIKRTKNGTDSNVETISQIDAFIQQTSGDTKNSSKQEVSNCGASRAKVYQCETLSQIERFVKQPFTNTNKSPTKKTVTQRTTWRPSATAVVGEVGAQAETLSQIAAFVKEPLNSKEENAAMPDFNQGPSKLSDIPENNPGDDGNNPELETSKIKAGISKRATRKSKASSKKEPGSNSDLVVQSIDKNTSVAHREQNPVIAENSFALLEAKSTKTRKSQRLTGSAEIKVAVCKNRRSMTTSAISECLRDFQDSVPATRKLLRNSGPSVDNNNVDKAEESKSKTDIGNSGKVNATSKRKLEPKAKGLSSEKSVKDSSEKVLKKQLETITEQSLPSTSKAKPRVKREHVKGSDSDASSCTSSDSVFTTPSKRGRWSVQKGLPATAEKLKRKQKPKIVFTMLDSPLLESLIRQMGGSVVDSVDASTVLVTEHVKRSQKLLTAVGQGKPICSPKWIHESKKSNGFLDPWDYILLDEDAEAKWNFSLRESITRASQEKLFANYTFQIMVNNAADVLKGAIEACGGKCVPRYPGKSGEGFFVVVASPEGRSKYLKVKKQHPQVTVVEPEAIFDGVLRQELRLGRHLLT